MERRGFIKVLVAGGTVAVFPAVLGGCTSVNKPAMEIEQRQEEIMLKLISYAMLAPNSHNIQPWRVIITGKDSLDLYVDPERLLPRTDPPARQIHISQGTFLETFRIAASHFGYKAEIVYFPKGEYDNKSIEDKPVASVRLVSTPDMTPDPLFKFLTTRQSNKREYSNRRIAERELAGIRTNHPDEGLSAFADGSHALRSQLAPILGKGMAIESADRNRNIETADIFRFSEKEAIAKGDGFSVANNGITGVMRFIVESFFLGTREEAYEVDSAFAKEGIKLAYRQAESAAAYGWIVSQSNTRLDQLMAGHLYARINLLTTQSGIAQHPMSQVIQEYEDMTALQQEFLQLLKVPRGSTVQMVYRLGYADPNPYTQRRRTKDILSRLS